MPHEQVVHQHELDCALFGGFQFLPLFCRAGIAVKFFAETVVERPSIVIVEPPVIQGKSRNVRDVLCCICGMVLDISKYRSGTRF